MINSFDGIKVYTLSEVEKMLRVTRRTLYVYIESGDLKAFKVGKSWRVTDEALKDFIEKRSVKN